MSLIQPSVCETVISNSYLSEQCKENDDSHFNKSAQGIYEYSNFYFLFEKLLKYFVRIFIKFRSFHSNKNMYF